MVFSSKQECVRDRKARCQFCLLPNSNFPPFFSLAPFFTNQVSGGRESLAALDALDEFWREIKVEIMLARQPEVMIADTTERYKSPFERAGGNAGADELETSLAGEDWDEEEEEKLIRASRAPRHEPWHPYF